MRTLPPFMWMVPSDCGPMPGRGGSKVKWTLPSQSARAGNETRIASRSERIAVLCQTPSASFNREGTSVQAYSDRPTGGKSGERGKREGDRAGGLGHREAVR